MSWFFKLLDSAGVNQAGVDTDNQVKVKTNTDLTKVGYIGQAGVVDLGTVTGAPTGRPIYVAVGGRQAIGAATCLWDDVFNSTAQNTGCYRVALTTHTYAQAGGVAVLNNTGLTGTTTNSALQTYKSFPIFGNAETRVHVHARFASGTTHVANNTTEFGLMTATLPSSTAPLDGVFFRYNTANELRGVVSFNGTETQTAAITRPADNVMHQYLIIAQNEVVTFWIDGILRASINMITDAPAQAQGHGSGSGQLTARQYIGGAAPATATKLEVGAWHVYSVGADQNRPFSKVAASLGRMGYQGQNGGTMGSTANYANSANPTAAVPTNTTAALGTGLGGQFWETASLAVNTDGIISSYQNPAPTATLSGRNLVINGVSIDSYVQTVIAGGPYVAQWSLAFGHTAVSLATAEAVAAKAPRRVALGNQLITAAQAVSTLVPNRISVRFDGCPIVVAPGEFVATVTKHIGTVGTSGTVAHVITFDAYWE